MPSRLYVFCEVDKITIANSIAAMATGNPYDANSTFTVALSSDGNEPITHFGASAIIDDNTRINLLQLIQLQSDIIYAYYIVTVSKPYILQSPITHPMLGTDNFTFDIALQDLRLQRITEPLTPDMG